MQGHRQMLDTRVLVGWRDLWQGRHGMGTGMCVGVPEACRELPFLSCLWGWSGYWMMLFSGYI